MTLVEGRLFPLLVRTFVITRLPIIVRSDSAIQIGRLKIDQIGRVIDSSPVISSYYFLASVSLLGCCDNMWHNQLLFTSSSCSGRTCHHHFEVLSVLYFNASKSALLETISTLVSSKQRSYVSATCWDFTWHTLSFGHTSENNGFNNVRKHLFFPSTAKINLSWLEIKRPLPSSPCGTIK